MLLIHVFMYIYLIHTFLCIYVKHVNVTKKPTQENNMKR